jgi:hypothetical protein
MSNIYTNPEKYGLTILEEVHAPLSYEFDIVLLFGHAESGRRGWASDSGCSCPSPFEYQGLESITWLETMTDYENLQHELDTMRGADPTDKVSMLRLAAEAVRKIKLGRHERSE